MKSVNVAELKNRLSHYLRLVRRGESLLVRDRDRVIARIDPAHDPGAADTDEGRWLGRLESQGLVRRGTGRIDRAVLARRPRIEADAVAALLSEREESR